MDNQSVLRLARFLRLGKFQPDMDAIPWDIFPAISTGERRGALRAAKQIADQDTLPTDLPVTDSVSQYYPGDSNGPLGTQQATMDLDVEMSRPGQDTFTRHIRVQVSWGDAIGNAVEQIEHIIQGWKAAYGDMIPEFWGGSFYIY